MDVKAENADYCFDLQVRKIITKSFLASTVADIQRFGFMFLGTGQLTLTGGLCCGMKKVTKYL